MDVLVNASVAEPFGIVIVEGLSQAVPVVGRRRRRRARHRRGRRLGPPDRAAGRGATRRRARATGPGPRSACCASVAPDASASSITSPPRRWPRSSRRSSSSCAPDPAPARRPGRRVAMPHAALVHDNFTGPTGMGVVLGRHAQWLLDAGWSLTLVGENIPTDLAARCRVVRVPAPRQLPSLARAHRLVRCALGARCAGVGPTWFTLIRRSWPEQADIVTSHFMAHPSHMRGARELATGLSGRAAPPAGRRHAAGSTTAPTSGWPQAPAYVSFVSEFLREEFSTWYGRPRGGWVFAPPAPAWRPVAETEREAARGEFAVPQETCASAMWAARIRARATRISSRSSASGDVTLLLAGPGSERIRVGGRPRHRLRRRRLVLRCLRCRGRSRRVRLRAGGGAPGGRARRPGRDDAAVGLGVGDRPNRRGHRLGRRAHRSSTRSARRPRPRLPIAGASLPSSASSANARPS